MANNHHDFGVRVYFEDTDAGGVVYYANYLKFLERGRTELTRAAGVNHSAAFNSGLPNFMVYEIHAKYLKSARLDDYLNVRTRFRINSRARINAIQSIHLNDQVLLTAEVVLVCVDNKGNPVRIPQEFIDATRDYIVE